MRKFALILIISLIFITGCNMTKISDASVNDIIETVLYKENKLSNVSQDGYKFYLPKGLKLNNKSDYNVSFSDNNTKYYLYVDTIAYYYKADNTYEINDNHFYSKKLNNGVPGYIDIDDQGDKYFIVIMYNYAKIEAYVNKEDFNDSLVNMCYVLSTLKFNDGIIKDYIGESNNVYQEEEFDIFSSKQEEDSFLTTYDNEYGTYKGDETIKTEDTDVVDIEEFND